MWPSINLDEHKSKEKEKEMYNDIAHSFLCKKHDVATQRIFVGRQNSRKWNENCLLPFDTVTKKCTIHQILRSFEDFRFIYWHHTTITSGQSGSFQILYDLGKLRFVPQEVCMYTTQERMCYLEGLRFVFNLKGPPVVKSEQSYTQKKERSVVHWTSLLLPRSP